MIKSGRVAKGTDENIPCQYRESNREQLTTPVKASETSASQEPFPDAIQAFKDIEQSKK